MSLMRLRLFARRRFRVAGLCLFLTMSAAACGSSSDSSTAIGELGNGDFTYRCVSVDDPACAGDITYSGFPSCLLEHGEFGLDYTLRDQSSGSGSAVPFVYAKSASESYIDDRGDFEALRSGKAGVVAYVDDIIVDFVHFDIGAVSDFDVVGDYTLADDDEVVVALQEEVALHVLPATLACDRPGGWVQAAGETEQTDIATVSGSRNGLLVVGRAAGTTRLTVTVGGLQRAFTVVVIPGNDGGTSTGETSTGPGSTETSGTVGETGGTATDGTGTDTGATDGGSSSGTGMAGTPTGGAI